MLDILYRTMVYVRYSTGLWCMLDILYRTMVYVRYSTGLWCMLDTLQDYGVC